MIESIATDQLVKSLAKNKGTFVPPRRSRINAEGGPEGFQESMAKVEGLAALEIVADGFRDFIPGAYPLLLWKGPITFIAMEVD